MIDNQFKVDVILNPLGVSIESLADYLGECSSVVRSKAPKDNIKLFMRLSEESYGKKPSRLFEYIPCKLDKKPDFSQTFGYMYKGEYWTNLRELLMNGVTMDDALPLVDFSHQMTVKCVAPYFIYGQVSTHNQITSVSHSKRYTESNAIVYNSKSRLYCIWAGMKTRCMCTTHHTYSNYGGKGITICNEWLNSFDSFKEWAIANNYDDTLSIDRINNDGNYEPYNCRWSDRLTQQRNTRKLKSTNTSGFRGAFFDKKRNKYIASIHINYKKKFIGRFNTSKEAGEAYDNYVIENKLEHTLNFSQNKNIYKNSKTSYWIPEEFELWYEKKSDKKLYIYQEWAKLIETSTPQELRDYMKHTIGIKRLEVYGRGADSLQLREYTLGGSLANPNGWKHFVNQRMKCNHTQAETRQLAKMIFDAMGGSAYFSDE